MNRIVIAAVALVAASAFCARIPRLASAQTSAPPVPVATPTPDPVPLVAFGDDVFLGGAYRKLAHRCAGIVVNRASYTTTRRFFVDAARAHGDLCVGGVYTTERKLPHEVGAGSARTLDGIPVYHLPPKAPHFSAAMLARVDVLLVDLQDVGDTSFGALRETARVLDAARVYHKDVWVLDRPNPMACDIVEGPLLPEPLRPGGAIYDFPKRHGMTLGEFARFANGAFHYGVTLQVIPIRGYTRGMQWGDLAVRWVPPSETLPFWQSTLVAPGTKQLANYGLDIAFGTQAPYQWVGTRTMDAAAFAGLLNAQKLPGVQFNAYQWRPTTKAPTKTVIHGIDIGITAPRTYRSVRTGFAILLGAIAEHAVNPKSYRAAMRRDWGPAAFAVIQNGTMESAMLDRIDDGVAEFTSLRNVFILY